jgi:RHH-type rel operon transcriptional repressor/antitoxin RelB|uniref:DNA-binding domain protein n=2 Tax=Acidipropionibacterium TaxID=1912215 RepID=Q9L459_9ACTN|nr:MULTISPECIES: ribbon-helix-helix protein, CopG family [Acidipropionibacterium]AFK88681.1 DNA-binding domain protein [Acidipropionibacterium jensenii]BAB17917.1 unnamed protein product [Acidipropionibacterium acidipropionici]CAB88394.1 hypothetical protein [Acidipropionibacterium jensenii]
MTIATSVKLSEETGRKLDELARATGRSKSYYLREAIEDHIDQMVHDYAIARLADDVRAGRAATYSADEVDQILGLDD